MMNHFLKYGNVFCSLEHSVDSKKKSAFNILTLKKKKNELEVLNKEQFLDQDDAFDFLKDQKHLFLAINNEQVLTKKSNNNSDNPLEIVKNTFQNLNINDFYYQVDDLFVTICRKNYVNGLIDLYSKNGISVIGFSLGNGVVNNIISYINDTILYTSNAKITLNKNTIETIESESNNRNYIINGIHLSNNHIVNLSSILYGYFKNGNTQIGFQNRASELKTAFLDKRIFKLRLNFSLGLLLTILLINFLVFSSYSGKINQLNNDLLVDETQKKYINRLQEDIKNKETLLKDLNDVLQSDISKYIDKIAESVPNTILLEELNYQPLKSNIRIDKEMLFNKGIILVKGTTKNDAVFSLWTGSLGNKEWIKEIIFQDFKTTKTGTSDFEFLIHIKND